MSETHVISGDAWHDIRQRHIGGSEVSALFDVQPAYALSRYGLWMVKSGCVPPPEVDNPRTQWGNRLESVIAEGCAEQEGWKIRKGGYFSDPQCAGLGATLDFVIESGEDASSGPGVLEIKNVDWMVHARSWTDGEPPLHILLQLQHQLAACGYTWGVVGELVGGNDLHIYRYEARPKLIADIRRRVSEFWQSVHDGNEPRVDGSDSSAAILRALHAVVRDEEADLSDDNELPEICAGLLAATEARKTSEKTEAEFKNRLVAKLADSKRAVCQGFRINTAVTPGKPPRSPAAGEMIPGRKESRRYTVKEYTA